MRLPNIFEPGVSARDSSMRAEPPLCRNCFSGRATHLQAQQPAFQRAIPHRVHALGADAELEAGIR